MFRMSCVISPVGTVYSVKFGGLCEIVAYIHAKLVC